MPLPTCDPTAVDPGSPYGTLFQWEEAGPFTVTGCDQSGWVVRSSGYAENARGYTAIIPSSSFTLDMQGTANTGSQSLTGLSHTNATGDGFHLVSNCYPSPIEWNAPSGFDAAAYFWQSSGSYNGTYQAVLSGTGALIPSSQAFFVRVGSGTHHFTLNNSDRRRGDPAFIRTSNPLDELLEFVVTGNGFADKTDIYFSQSNVAGWNGQEDALKMKSTHNQPTIYTRANGLADWVSINGLPSLNYPANVTMGLMCGTSGNFTLQVNGLPDFETASLLLLEDLKNATIRNMTANNTYDFTADVLDDSERFVIHFIPPISVSAISENCNRAGGAILVDLWNHTIAGVSITWDNLSIEDSEGNLITATTNVSGLQTIDNLNPGFYTVLVEKDGFQIEVEIEVLGVALVTAQFTLTNSQVAVGNSVHFINQTSGAVQYAWNFGDGSPVSNLTHPSHVFTLPGVYQVTLQAVGGDCEDVFVEEIEVISGPTVVVGISGDLGYLTISDGDFIRIFNQSGVSEKVGVRVMTFLGQEVFSVETLVQKEITIDISAEPDAYFMVEIRTPDLVYVTKVLKSTL